MPIESALRPKRDPCAVTCYASGSGWNSGQSEGDTETAKEEGQAEALREASGNAYESAPVKAKKRKAKR